MTNTIKAHTIQFKTTEIEGDILHHMVYETDIYSAEDLLALSLTLGRYTKFKRKSDKRWYTFRAFAKRLFQGRMFDKEFEKLIVIDPIEEYETNIK